MICLFGLRMQTVTILSRSCKTELSWEKCNFLNIYEQLNLIFFLEIVLWLPLVTNGRNRTDTVTCLLMYVFTKKTARIKISYHKQIEITRRRLKNKCELVLVCKIIFYLIISDLFLRIYVPLTTNYMWIILLKCFG